eukprot:s6312_g6.t1
MHAEEFAARLLQVGDFSRESLQKLFLLLPLEPPARGVGVGDSGSFTTGAYFFAGEVGLRFPRTSALLAEHVKRLSPSFPFTTVALFRNLKTPCHQDNNNFPGSFNLVAPMSDFEHGEIWCERADGPVSLEAQGSLIPGILMDAQASLIPGILMDVARGPLLLPASTCRHSTCDWSGDRLVLVAFSIREALNLPASASSVIQDLGFRCPESVESLTNPVPLQSPSVLPAARPLMVEVFSGSGGMAAAFRDLGFLTLAVDKVSNAHRLRHSFVPLDLTRSDHQQLLLSALDDAALVGVIHLGVPCGTCSRARERALPLRLRDRFRAPAPLRDARFPLGKPGLRGADRDRVRSANELYKFALR